MNEAQISAFQAGSSAKPAEMQMVFVSLLCAALLLWAAWVCLRAYTAWGAGGLSLKQFGSIVARTALLLLVSFWLVLS